MKAIKRWMIDWDRAMVRESVMGPFVYFSDAEETLVKAQNEAAQLRTELEQLQIVEKHLRDEVNSLREG